LEFAIFVGLPILPAFHFFRSGHSAESRNIIGIANSILVSGYHAEETIISRDVLPGICKLRFGNGMKRGLAVKLVFLGFEKGKQQSSISA